MIVGRMGIVRELKQLRRRPQRRLKKTIGLMINTILFGTFSLTSTARLRRESS